MGWLTGIPAWFADPANWRGEAGVPTLFLQHLGYSAAALGLACLVALPVGVWLGHTGRGGVLAQQVGNAGRAVPVLALLGVLLLVPGFGRTWWTLILCLTLFAIPPILTNAYTGLREVDRGVVDAARGMGMSEGEVLRRVELPLATPLLMNGVRQAAVQVVATTSIAALFAFGGLGRIITRATGSAGIDLSAALAGTLLIAAFALVVEYGLAWAGHRADPVARARRTAQRRAVTTS
ncbi:osmoprotectant transport system permease protein [Quadrisphaera granulorum]|uniref:Osmoprotectant transport system permease protein n=1 Tax=Quadrisphaera granulorum TaxID=317664 RepID=A0A316A776_9ACTN|nr:ABC transporter permease [Quadrisphaera granulorum]PWJ53299.1 osmoprotectant transport system permease protein [Quadrisphaera granulorum]SZE96973.1 osmoprotectant transport system permease protein [Quadrisphaera granulorum]